MNSLEQERQEIMEDMLHGPPVVYVVVLNYREGSQRAFTFSIKDNMAEFLEYITECGEELDVVSYVFFETMLDLQYPHEYEFWSTEH